MHDAHRKAAEQHDLAAITPPNAPLQSTTKREMTPGDAGIRSERWSIPITLTSWRRKPTTSRARS